jgi:hypothetical protein
MPNDGNEELIDVARPARVLAPGQVAPWFAPRPILATPSVPQNSPSLPQATLVAAPLSSVTSAIADCPPGEGGGRLPDDDGAPDGEPNDIDDTDDDDSPSDDDDSADDTADDDDEREPTLDERLSNIPDDLARGAYAHARRRIINDHYFRDVDWGRP